MKKKIIDQIALLLKDSTPALKNSKMYTILLRHLVRWYPQVTADNSDVYAASIAVFLQTCEVSERAGREIKSIISTKGLKHAEKRRLFKERIHLEHNRSVSNVASELLALVTIRYETIHAILEHDYTVVLITKEEAKVLNGSSTRQYPLDGKIISGAGMVAAGTGAERLAAINARLLTLEDRVELANLRLNHE